MALAFTHHVHSECYSERDEFEVRIAQLHTDRGMCELTMCLWADMTYAGRHELNQQAKDLKKEMARLIRQYGMCDAEGCTLPASPSSLAGYCGHHSWKAVVG